MAMPPVTRVVLYKHGVGYFEREGTVEGDEALALSFKQDEVSDVLKSLVALDLDGGHVATVSYDSTESPERRLAEVALTIPDRESLAALLGQVKGARVAVQPEGRETIEGLLVGVDRPKWPVGDGVMEAVLVSLLTDSGALRSFPLHELAGLRLLDDGMRRDLDYYLRTELSAKKKDARAFTILARGSGTRRVRLGYTVEAPVWKATYRLILGEEGRKPTIQGWAVVDNIQDEDWVDVALTLVAGLPVSFIHDLYTPRHIRRPEIAVQETTGVLPPLVEDGMELAALAAPLDEDAFDLEPGPVDALEAPAAMAPRHSMLARNSAVSTTKAQVRERKLGDLFQYAIEHPVTIRRNQSALVPILLREFRGRPVLLYNKANRAENPLRCVEFENTTGLTLEGGPVTVLEGGDYVGEAMLETLRPGELRLVPYAVELGVRVLDSIDTHEDEVTQVVVHRGALTLHYGESRQTTYTLRSHSEEEMVVYLEHPRSGADWELYDTPDPLEITESYWRFRLGLRAGETRAFVVKQSRPLEIRHELASLDSPRLAAFIKRRYFDKRSEATLQRVLDLRDRASRHEEAAGRLRKEREAIHADQNRVRENLQSLGDRPSEKALRERYVRGLEAQEDRLIAIEREIGEELAERDGCRKAIDELLASLDLKRAL